MRRRGIRGGRDRLGSPTIDPPEPQGIDDYTGFKVPLKALKKDWSGLMAVDPDRRNPQDFVRGVRDNAALPVSRPEPEGLSVALPLLWEDGSFIMAENGTDLLYSEGVLVTPESL